MMSNKGVVKLFKYTWKDIQFNSDTESSNFMSSPQFYVCSAPNFMFSKFKNLISKIFIETHKP